MARIRRPIIPTDGSYLPTARALWGASAEKLNEAELCALNMRNVKDRVSYESAWAQAVDCLEEFWAKFYSDGKSVSSKFEPWAGKIIKERKDDQLLQYLTQARHQNQHGNLSIAWSRGSYEIGRNFAGQISDLIIYKDGTFSADISAHAKNYDPDIVKHVGGAPTLPAIHNRKFNQTFCPPVAHLGKSCLGLSPHAVILRGLAYYKKVLQDAVEKFS